MTENTPINPVSNGAGEANAQLSLQKVYIKDVSFEAPGAPQIFQEQGQPNVELNLSQHVAARRDRLRGRAERDRDLQDRRQDRVSRRSAAGRHLRPVRLRHGQPRRRARDVLPERAVSVRAPGRFRSDPEWRLPAVPPAADQLRGAVRRTACAVARTASSRAPTFARHFVIATIEYPPTAAPDSGDGSHAAVAVLGAGSWGTALAALLARNGVPTTLWGRDPAAVARSRPRGATRAICPISRCPRLQLSAELERDRARRRHRADRHAEPRVRRAARRTAPYSRRSRYRLGDQGLRSGIGPLPARARRRTAAAHAGGDRHRTVVRARSRARPADRGDRAFGGAAFAQRVAQMLHARIFAPIPATT